MMTAKRMNMEVLTDRAMSRLFRLAEYVLGVEPMVSKPLVSNPMVTSIPTERQVPLVQQELMPTIRFSNEDRMVEGELFQ